MKLGDKGKPERACAMLVYVPHDQVTVKHYFGRWDLIPQKAKVKQKIKISNVTAIMNAVKISGSIVNLSRDYSYALDSFWIKNLQA